MSELSSILNFGLVFLILANMILAVIGGNLTAFLGWFVAFTLSVRILLDDRNA
jgi:hypothetical protein